MINRLIPLAIILRQRFPRFVDWCIGILKRRLGQRFGVYPRIMADEVAAVEEVLRGGRWNMAYGKGLQHERLEDKFSDFTGSKGSVAVSSGGMALQIALRSIGLNPGDEVIHQVDTCSATALAIMAAGGVPVFVDVSLETFMIDINKVQSLISHRTRAIVVSHMWGNPDQILLIKAIAKANSVSLVEDCCLSLGTYVDGQHVGTFGDVGVFSFGCVKPIQTGEGGMIITNDLALAKEMRSMRHWGDRTIEYGNRDTTKPSWNGRMSEIIAAIAIQQLRGFNGHLIGMREAVASLSESLTRYNGLEIVLGASRKIEECSFSQVVLRLKPDAAGISKKTLMESLKNSGVPVWHANFEPITELTLFKTAEWRRWVNVSNERSTESDSSNYYLNANAIFSFYGLGLGKTNLLSLANRQYLLKKLDKILLQGHR